MAALIIFAGLPGSGKSTIAKGLAKRIGAVWLRIDSIEQAIRESGSTPNDAGYLAAYAIAKDNLRLGLTVIGDCVNYLMLSREAWRNVGQNTGATIIEIEVTCSDQVEHRRRVEDRESDVPGLRLPDWAAISRLEYESWDRPHTIIDTASNSIEVCVDQALEALNSTCKPAKRKRV